MNSLEKLYKEDLLQFGIKIFKACGNGDVELIKEFLNSDLAEKYSNVPSVRQMISECCDHGHIDILKCIFESPKLKKFSHTSANYNNCYSTACREGNLELLKFTIEELPIVLSGSNLYTGLMDIVKNDYPQLLKYLFSSTKLNLLPGEFAKGTILSSACEHGSVENIKCLFSLIDSAGLDTKIYLHKNNDAAFETAQIHNHSDILRFFIFDLNMEKTQSIEKILEDNPNGLGEKLFKLRELSTNLHNELHENLENKNENGKKLKI
jgi:hypothetical protein